jgi:hypothetical protein
MDFPFNAFVVDYSACGSSIWPMFCFNLLFKSWGESMGKKRRLSTVMSVNAPLLEGRVRQRALEPGFTVTLDGILTSDILKVRYDCAVLIRR